MAGCCSMIGMIRSLSPSPFCSTLRLLAPPLANALGRFLPQPGQVVVKEWQLFFPLFFELQSWTRKDWILRRYRWLFLIPMPALCQHCAHLQAHLLLQECYPVRPVPLGVCPDTHESGVRHIVESLGRTNGSSGHCVEVGQVTATPYSKTWTKNKRLT